MVQEPLSVQIMHGGAEVPSEQAKDCPLCNESGLQAGFLITKSAAAVLVPTSRHVLVTHVLVPH